MLRKMKAVLLAALFFAVSVSGYAMAAEQSTDTGTGTISGTPDKYVEIQMENSAINFGTFTVNDQKAINQRTDANGKYVIFDSLKLAAGKNIIFNEGASNSNIFAKVTYTGETYPATGGLNNIAWMFLKDQAGTGYVQNEITGSLTSGGGGVTMPSGVTEIGSYSAAFIYYTTADSGATWTRASKTIYVALGDNSRLYVNDNAVLSDSIYYTAKGGVVSTPFLGNNIAETSTFPTAVGNTVTLDFGYMINWDSTQANTHETFSTLIDLPMNAPYNHNWTWNLSAIVEYYSAP